MDYGCESRINSDVPGYPVRYRNIKCPESLYVLAKHGLQKEDRRKGNHMRKRRRRGSYKFTEKTHSKRGIAASILAGLLLVWYLVFVILAFRCDGRLSAYFGSAGVMAVLLSIVVLVVAAGSLKEEDSFKLFPRLSCFLAVLGLVCWGGTYVLGFFL